MLFYGEGGGEVNVGGGIGDSRTPGYDQIGTVWLAVLHLLTLPLVSNDRWWQSGLAGAIPSSACFVLAGIFLFAAMRRAAKSSAAAWAALGLFALNPNLLYLQSTPMMEPVFLAGFMALLYFTVLFRDTQSVGAVIGAALASLAGLLGVIRKRLFWPVFLVSLPPMCYLWSMHAGQTPIFVPQLWFGSYYNTRYALSVLPLLAIAGGCLPLLAGNKLRPFIAVAVVVLGAMPWLLHREPQNWICWRESQVNSEARRAWTPDAAQFMQSQYRPGEGIFTSLGDLAARLLAAGIP